MFEEIKHKMILEVTLNLGLPEDQSFHNIFGKKLNIVKILENVEIIIFCLQVS